jgi:anthranilate phosphoribosyltransferase
MSTANVTPRRARYEGFRSTIKAVGTGERGRRSLTFAEAREAMAALLAGTVSPAQAGAFLIAMRLKGEVPDELAGLAQGLRDSAPELRGPSQLPLVATAGAYDGVSEAPHLSLAAGVTAAACGAGVVMHCGSTLGPKFGVTPADVLAALGGPRRPSPGESEAMLARAGVTLVHAAEALPGWAALAELRDEVGPRGPVHSAEKLVDWFGARRFVVGYTHQPYRERLLGALALLGAREAIAVRGLEGSDVLRPGRPAADAPTGPRSRSLGRADPRRARRRSGPGRRVCRRAQRRRQAVRRRGRADAAARSGSRPRRDRRRPRDGDARGDGGLEPDQPLRQLA